MRDPVGSITVICGSMFSGKTEELIRLVRRAMHAKKRVQVFKSALETRCETTVIRTHDGASFNALAVRDTAMLESLLEPEVQVVGIEEVQFFDEAVVELCQHLANRGIQVIVAGLDQDFRGQPFTFMPTLMALADNVLKLHAICKICGGEASRTQRLVNGKPAAWNEPTILIGAEESYEARCRRCHRVRDVPKGPRDTVRSSAKVSTQEAATNGKNGHRPSATARSLQRKNLSAQEIAAAAGIRWSTEDDGTQLEMFAEPSEGS